MKPMQGIVVLLALFTLLGFSFWSLDAGDKKGPEILTILKGHSELVYNLAFSSDGKHLATASFDNTVKLWEAATGKEIKTFGGPQGHQKMVLSVALSNDGSMIASGSVDNTLKIWDVPLGSPLRNLAAQEAVIAVTLSADSAKLAVGTKDGLVKVFTTAEFKELFKCEKHDSAVTSLAFSANGQVLASSGADKTLRFWNAANGQLMAIVGAHTAAANAVAIHPNNNAAYSVGDDGLLKTWNVPPPASKPMPAHAANIHALVLSADGNQVWTGGADKIVRQSLTQGKEVRVFSGVNGEIKSLAVHPQGNLLAAGATDNRLHLWNVADGKPVTQWVAHSGSVTSAGFHPQNPQLMTAGADGLVKIWALPTPARVLSHPDAVLTATPIVNGQKLLTGSADKILRLWDVAKLNVERQFAGHTGPVTAAVANANAQLIVSGGGEGTIRIWNPATGKESDILLGHNAGITSLALNPAGNVLVSTGADGQVGAWQLPIAPVKAMPHPDQIAAVALSSDATKLVTGGADKIARLWHLANAAKERDFPGPTLAITSVALSPNGTLVAAGSADKTVHVWSVADGKLLQKIALPAVVQAVAFHPDNKTLAAGLADNTLKLLGAGDGKEMKSLGGHSGAVQALAFSAKGDLLFSGGADKSVQIWTLPDAAAKSRLQHPAAVAQLALSKDGTRLAAAGDKSVKVWNLADGKEIASFACPAEIKDISLSLDSTRIVVGCADKLARVYTLGGTFVEAFAHDGPVHAVAFVNPKAVLSAGADKVAKLWTSAVLWQGNDAGPARQALFTPKGDQVLTAGDDKNVKFWNAADGKLLKTLAAHDGPVISMTLSADGARLITAGDKTVKSWNLTAKPGTPEEAKPSAVFTLAAPAQCLALSPNGTRLAVGVTEGAAQFVRVFDLSLNKEIQSVAEHAGPIASLAFLPDNRTLASASQDKTARLLDVSVLTVFDAHPGGVVSAQYHGNGAQLVTAGADKTVKLWDLTKNAVIKAFGPLPEPIRFAGFNRDFTLIGVCTGKTVKVWNIADGKEILNLNHAADVLSLSFSVDKTKIVTGSADKITRVFEFPSGRELQFFPQDDAVAHLAFMPQNNAVVSAAGKTLRLDTLAIARVIAADAGPVYGLTLNPPGTHAFTAGVDKVVKMWNLQNGNLERSFAGAGATLRSIAISKNNQILAAAGDDQTVRIFNLADGKELGTVKASAPVKSISITANNQVLVASCADKHIHSWSVNFQPGQPMPADFLKPVQTFVAPNVVNDLALAGDNVTFYTAAANKAVHAWKLASPAPTQNYPHPNHVDAVAFQPNGTLLATGCHDGKIRIYDLVKKALAKEINAHPTQNATMIYTVVFTPDGKQLLSAGYDQSLKLWDPVSGNLVREFKAFKVKDFEKGHQDGVFSAAFSPDGKFLASGSGGLERVIKIWNVGDGSVVRDLANPNIKTAPKQPVSSHPGWVYNLRFTKDGKHLVSVGDAPLNKGFLAVWNAADGKMLYGETMTLGSFFGLAIAPNDQVLAIGAGPRTRAAPDLNSAYLIKMPVK
ncbi:MAG: WD40 repeat domain-containing protein [Gemmataceae bacterium]|nr:WD40 repeat domain-containing protein [Gemmataceae bacterium]